MPKGMRGLGSKKSGGSSTRTRSNTAGLGHGAQHHVSLSRKRAVSEAIERLSPHQQGYLVSFGQEAKEVAHLVGDHDGHKKRRETHEELRKMHSDWDASGPSGSVGPAATRWPTREDGAINGTLEESSFAHFVSFSSNPRAGAGRSKAGLRVAAAARGPRAGAHPLRLPRRVDLVPRAHHDGSRSARSVRGPDPPRRRRGDSAGTGRGGAAAAAWRFRGDWPLRRGRRRDRLGPRAGRVRVRRQRHHHHAAGRDGRADVPGRRERTTDTIGNGFFRRSCFSRRRRSRRRRRSPRIPRCTRSIEARSSGPRRSSSSSC